MRIRTLCSLLVAFVFASACSHSAQPARGPTQSRAAGVDAPRSGSIFFWRASKKGKPGSVYLLGSIHVRGGKASLDRAITDAATECERGAFELDLDAVDPNETNDFIRSEGILKDQTLKDVVTPETFAAWTKVVSANHLPRTTLEKFKPWMAALAMQVAVLEKRGIVGDQGVDKMLYAFEKQEPSKSRKVVGLETSLEQLRLFSRASAKVQELMLRSTAMEIDKDQFGKIVTLYETGDEAGMNAFMDRSRKDEPETKPFWDAVFDHRNATMTEKIVPMFDMAGCTVVTVGAGHVVGESGLVRRLRDRGFEVERVSSRGPTDSSKMAFTLRKPKEFVSREDGFSVRMSSKPTIQETPVPGMPMNARTYVFADGVTIVMMLTVLPLSNEALVARVGTMLEPLAKQGLSLEGVEVTRSGPMLVQGNKAVRVHGDHGQGDLRAALSVTWLHENRLYSIMAKLLGDGDQNQLEEQMNNFLAGFQHTP